MRRHDSTCICDACLDEYDRHTRRVASNMCGPDGADEVEVNDSPKPDGSTCPCRECRWWRERKEAEEARQKDEVEF